MVRKDGSYVKTERMRLIAAYTTRFLQNGGKININKLKAWIEVNIGLSPIKAGEYIDTLVSAYDWEIVDGCLIATC